MTSHTDLNIPNDIYEAALRVMGHPWQAGQRCEHHVTQTPGRHSKGKCLSCECAFDEWDACKHVVTIPAVTDELLWDMLVKGLERDRGFLLSIDYYVVRKKELGAGAAAAVIRATAALEVK